MSSRYEASLVLADRGRLHLQRALAVAVFLLAAVGALAGSDLEVQLIVLAAGASGAFALVRLAGMRVVADDKGIVLKGPLASTWIGWQEIERFVMHHPRRAGDALQAIVELRSGSTVILPGLDPPFAILRPTSAGIKPDVVAVLNDRLCWWREARAEEP